jgi:predicted alpha/beta-fold hydrolase
VLSRITLPTLLINARNDPFLPEAALPRIDEVSPAVRCEFSAEGGHAGFVSGRFPGNLRWLPRRLISFFRETSGTREIVTQRGADEIMTARNAPPR